MADVTINYKGSEIASLSDTGSTTLLTAGKYCEADIVVGYTKPSGGGGVQTANVTISDNDGDALYYTDANMTAQVITSGSKDLASVPLPLGSLLIYERDGTAPPMPFPMVVSGITLRGSYTVGSRGAVKIYEVTG